MRLMHTAIVRRIIVVVVMWRDKSRMIRIATPTKAPTPEWVVSIPPTPIIPRVARISIPPRV
jgi:hypothetical protein